MNLRVLLSTTCVGSLALASVSAFAQTTVTDERTAPLVTSTAGNVLIRTDAELNVASGPAITVNSNNTVVIENQDDDVDDDERGILTGGGGNGATGILIQPNVSTTITNNGAISVLESFEPEDEDENGIAEGPIASASERYGIRAAPGGTLTGTITNTGLIAVEGLNSGGIVLETALDGSLEQSGSVQVGGDNGIGVRTGNVSGNIVLEGATTVVGRGSRALSVEGDVGGSIRIQGSVGHATGFTYDDDGNTIYLSRFDQRRAAPAATIGGSVGGGIIIARPPSNDDDDNDDEDNDGVDDIDEGTGSITSFGNAPALQIAGGRDITIGRLPAANGGYSLLVDGSISGTASYSRTDAYGLVIGGGAGRVNLPGGIGINGSVSATSSDSAATALLINQGATIGSIYNSGSIQARISSPGEGEAYGIYDLSGSLTTIENTGSITAIGSITDIVRAIYLPNTTRDVSITQYLNADDAETRADIEEDLDEDEEDTTVYTSITGSIETGSGNDTLTVSSGTVTGNTFFNDGNDRLLLSGDSRYSGQVYFGNGVGTASLSGEAFFDGAISFGSRPGSLSIVDSAEFNGTVDFGSQAGTLTLSGSATFLGGVANGTRASVLVEGGTFGADEARSFALGSLVVRSGGTLRAYIDGDTQTSSHITANTATFESGATVTATVNSLLGAEGSYTILSANNIGGNPTFDETNTRIPFIFVGSLNVVNNDLILDIRRKLASEVGLRSAAADGYNAILTAAIEEDVVSQSFLEIEDEGTLQTQVAQMLPDHAGGLFDSATRTTRLISQHIMDRDATFDFTEIGGAVLWLDPIAWRSNRRAKGTNAYKSNAGGLSGGIEWLTDIGYIGGSVSWAGGGVDNNGGTGKIGTSQTDVGLFWRTGRTGPLYAYVRIGGARTSYSSERTVEFTANDVDYSTTSTANWNGWLISGMGGVSYDFNAASRFRIRPRLGVEWFQQYENGYEESGGGDAIDLTVGGRTSNSVSGISTLALSYAIGPTQVDYIPFTLEIEGGRRTVISGKHGATTANFLDADSFTITPDAIDNSWTSEIRLTAGGYDYTWKLAAGAEKTRNGAPSYSARASLSIAF